MHIQQAEMLRCGHCGEQWSGDASQCPKCERTKFTTSPRVAWLLWNLGRGTSQMLGGQQQCHKTLAQRVKETA